MFQFQVALSTFHQPPEKIEAPKDTNISKGTKGFSDYINIFLATMESKSDVDGYQKYTGEIETCGEKYLLTEFPFLLDG
jgi:hypothetical protein